MKQKISQKVIVKVNTEGRRKRRRRTTKKKQTAPGPSGKGSAWMTPGIVYRPAPDNFSTNQLGQIKQLIESNQPKLIEGPPQLTALEEERQRMELAEKKLNLYKQYQELNQPAMSGLTGIVDSTPKFTRNSSLKKAHIEVLPTETETEETYSPNQMDETIFLPSSSQPLNQSTMMTPPNKAPFQSSGLGQALSFQDLQHEETPAQNVSTSIEDIQENVDDMVEQLSKNPNESYWQRMPKEEFPNLYTKTGMLTKHFKDSIYPELNRIQYGKAYMFPASAKTRIKDLDELIEDMGQDKFNQELKKLLKPN
jgi:hypothetical protein